LNDVNKFSLDNRDWAVETKEFPPAIKMHYLCYSMKESRGTRKGDKASTWLLTITLFLGLFAFSGNTSNGSSHEKESQTTELVVSIKTNPKRAASYARAFAQNHQANRCDFHQSEFDL